MRILFGEIRQYLRPVTLVIVGILVTMWYLYCGKDCNSMSQNNYSQPYLLSIEYQKRYGNSIDHSELEEIKSQHAEERAALDKLFDEYMGKYDIHSKNDFDLLYEIYNNEDNSEAYAEAVEKWGADGINEKCEQLEACIEIAWREPIVSAIFREQSMRSIIERFDIADRASRSLNANDGKFFGDESEYVKSRLKTSLDKGEISIENSVYSGSSSFLSHFLFWHILICIVCAFFIIPLPIKNKITGVKGMQFTSKTGKALVKKQLCTALIITVCANILIDVFFFSIYFFSKGNTRHLLNCTLNAGALGNALWLDLTYLDLVILCFFNTLLLSLALSCILFTAAYFSSNYIVASAAAIPCTVIEVLCFTQLVSQLSLRDGSAILFVVILIAAITAAAATTAFLMQSVKSAEYLE